MDRLLPFKVKRYERHLSENTLTLELLENRDLIWSEMMDDLNQIVNYLTQHDDQACESNFRMADFAEFGWKAMRSRTTDLAERQEIGQYWQEILDKLSQAQTEELMIDDPIFLCLEAWMEDPRNHDQFVKARELFMKLKMVAENIGANLPYRGPSGFGRKLRQIISNLELYYQIETRFYANTWYYKFSLNPEVEAE